VSYVALHSNKSPSNNARCSTSFSSTLRSQHDLEHLPTAACTDYTAETQRICMCYWAKRVTSWSCYLTPFTCPTLLGTLACLWWWSLLFLFKSSNNGEFIDVPCTLPWWLITIPSQKYISLDMLLEVLISRARNWILLCRTEMPFTKTPFAGVSINTHPSCCLFQPSLS